MPSRCITGCQLGITRTADRMPNNAPRASARAFPTRPDPFPTSILSEFISRSVARKAAK